MATQNAAGDLSASAAEPAIARAIPDRNRGRRQKKLAPWMEDTPLWLQSLKGVVLLAIAVSMLLPFLNVIAVSFSSGQDVIQGGFTLFPRNPTLESYRVLLSGGTVLRSLYVTIGITLVGVAVQLTFTTMLAYGLSRPSVPGSRFFLWLVLFSFLFGPGMIPTYLLVNELGMIDTYAALIVPGLIGAWNVIIMRNFFMNLPQELLDAARIDGASDFGVFWHIVLPLSKAVIAVIALFMGVSLWNTFFAGILYLNDAGKWPIQVVLNQYVLEGAAITSAADFAPDQPPPPSRSLQMAMVVIATVPILVVYPFLQKYFAKGVLTGAIKG